MGESTLAALWHMVVASGPLFAHLGACGAVMQWLLCWLGT